MKVSKKKDFDLQVILDEVFSLVSLNSDELLTYKNFYVSEYFRLLENVVNFPKSAVHISKAKSIRNSIRACLKKQVASEEDFLVALKDDLKTQLAVPEQIYYLLTSINLDCQDIGKQWQLFDCEIELLPNGFHKKFTGRSDVLKKINRESDKDVSPFGSCRMEVKVKSRSKTEAIQRGLKAVNFLRGLMCIELNSSSLIAGETYRPINKVRLGRYHTLHDEDGDALDDPIYYEPKFISASKVKPKSPVIFEKNLRFYTENISESPDSPKIEQAILRYVDALDESDNNVAVTKLWSVLETLIVAEQSNCVLMPKRIAALYNNCGLTKQMVLHIKDYRNTLVHTGTEDDNSIYRAYRLQEYFIRYLVWIIHPKSEVSSIAEANQMLDIISNGSDAITAKISFLEKALSLIDEANNA